MRGCNQKHTFYIWIFVARISVNGVYSVDIVRLIDSYDRMCAKSDLMI